MNTELWMAVMGGLCIGTSAVVLLSLAGRIAGVSGILWGALTEQSTHLWRWLFLLGLAGGGVAAHTLLDIPLPSPQNLPVSWAVVGGLLVGLGTRWGKGCTSGHGVCGIGLLAPRSAAATITFMGSGIITVYVARHVLGGGL
ncbi:YeeE/YedE family protein [Congregibacter brevis]|uniref:YeeE/YedE family protein n=1 Tax=Congregibacter brevis TaxID=3081201 RepID=A0ABZ0I8K3_9GAMM|nr:YeeE/YedE family protein [Congregibacter sp. IMCC45268]